MNIIIYDFGDSFTFNILSTFKSLGHNPLVKDINSASFKDVKANDLVVLGPGPGHIFDYKEHFVFIKKLLGSNVKILGICLGHQIIHHLLGKEIIQLEYPVHGQSKRIFFPDSNRLIDELSGKTLECQYYSSWAVKLEKEKSSSLEILDDKGLLAASFSENLVTYQFHPESIGTSFQCELLKQSLV
jgi:anthranilate/para-aminobenzoate synthase component II